ncbi:alcohol oxidase [Marasmius fiardii PR-910]|nr:alcohol oxidase [Marasmius fiardii PR-910]
MGLKRSDDGGPSVLQQHTLKVENYARRQHQSNRKQGLRLHRSGGTSGLPLAVRLSEDPSVSVLVIEAGQANLDDPDILTPAKFGSHFGNEKYDWNFKTLPQKHCFDRSVPWNRGKGLGGSSAINFFQFHRPAKSDIDAFEQLGNTGWNWNLLERYYAKTETFLEPVDKSECLRYDSSKHGKDGPLIIAYPATLSNFEQPYQAALRELNIDVVNEPFSGDTKGTWITPVSIDPRNRVRSYAANKYYQPNESRPNLFVLPSAHVTKILTEKSPDGNVTATAVEFIHDGATSQINVGKEVIVSSGVIMSPQASILELSGIGNPEILRKAGVEVQVELPGVGENLQEHLYAGVSRELREDIPQDFLTFDRLSDPSELARQQESYRKDGKGIFGMSVVCMTFVPLAKISPTCDQIQQSFKDSVQSRAASGAFRDGLIKQYEVQLQHIKDQEPSCEFVLSPRFTSRLNPPASGKQYITASTLLNHPFSRGTIHISSSDPLVRPEIDPNYLQEEYDLSSFVEQIKFARRILEQNQFKDLLTDTEVNPGPDVQTDEDIRKYLKNVAVSSWHAIGTCSMLPSQHGGVVDNKLKVYKTKNIRVADLSIVPLHIGAHTQATAYAIGELAADIIKGKVDLSG